MRSKFFTLTVCGLAWTTACLGFTALSGVSRPYSELHVA